MVYIADWDEFLVKAEALFLRRPDRTRYTFKYRHVDSQLVLKVTDDYTCLKYKTDQASDMKRVEKLNNLFLRLMSSKKLENDAARAFEEAKIQEQQQQKRKQQQLQQQRRRGHHKE
eukprot:TRINITY_DN51439_c0_g1_i2.p1 TRINITY_DN51439_c0_g1~~TRINITY_DN51439_c0_g1_i2.p1  ORF type:complete len:123 (+),score=61.30 TRINITY_DN51439_c0_g1_i2:24-371(+)